MPSSLPKAQSLAQCSVLSSMDLEDRGTAGGRVEGAEGLRRGAGGFTCDEERGREIEEK